MDNGANTKSTSYFTRLLQVINSAASIWIFILVLVIVRDVAGRYFFNRPLPGTPEIVSLSIITIAFLQFPYTLMINRHVSSNILFNKFPEEVKIKVKIIGCIIGAVLFFLLATSSWPLFVKAVETSHFEGYQYRIPSAPIRFSIVLGSALMALEYARKAFLLLNKKDQNLFEKEETASGKEELP